MSELFERPASELARLVREKQLSPVELVRAHIDRIEAVDPAINALVAGRFEEAMDEAKVAEEALTRAGVLPPLHGVPCTIKEFLEVDGLPHTCGLWARRERIGSADATVVARMRSAGAIVLGVSNVPEGGMWMETHNVLHGRTNNPWQLAHTPGGSSGGEGALIAAGASPLGIGSDIAGSIRIPAAFCGIYGHKPTGRMVPNTGHWGADQGEAAAFMTTGPMARSVRDLQLVLPLITGPDGADRFTLEWQLPSWSRSDLSKVTVYPMEAVGKLPVSPVMRAEVTRVTDLLVEAGARRGQLRVPLLDRAFQIWAVAMSAAAAGGPSFAAMLGDGEPIRLAAELFRKAIGRPSVTVPALALAILERATDLLPRSLSANVPTAAALATELEAAIGPDGVILCPPYTRPAPRHRAALLTPFHFLGTGIFNLVGAPVTQVPTGFDRRGLPLGVQIAARRGNDNLTLMVASIVEEASGAFRPATVPTSSAGGWLSRWRASAT